MTSLLAASPPFPLNARAAFYHGVNQTTFQVPASHPTWTDAMLAYDASSLKDYITNSNAFLDTNPLLDDRRTNVNNNPSYIFSTFHTDRVGGDKVDCMRSKSRESDACFFRECVKFYSLGRSVVHL